MIDEMASDGSTIVTTLIDKPSTLNMSDEVDRIVAKAIEKSWEP